MSAGAEPICLLFVCTANISRSPFAELLTADLTAGLTAGKRAGPRVRPASAGTHGFVDRPMDPPMAAELETRGIDASAFRSRRLTPALVAAADLVLTMEAAHRAFVLTEEPGWVGKVFTLGQFARVVDSIPALCGRDLVSAAAGRRSRQRPGDDVADAFGLGPLASARAAADIESRLRLVLPRLAAGRRNGG